MHELDAISEKRKSSHARLLKLGSRVYQAFLDLERATFSDGALPRRQKELVAIGVEVGIEMGGGPATVSARFALDVMDAVFGPQPAGG